MSARPHLTSRCSFVHAQAATGSLKDKSSQFLSPLAQHKYYRTEGQRLLFDFIKEFLGVEVIGFQQGYNLVPDQILFHSDKTGSTLCVPCSVMLLTHEQAAEVVQAKIKTNEAAFK